MISPPFWDNMTTPTDSVVIVDRLETQQEESDIDIDEDSSHVDPQTQYPFDFHFEFGSKRPPTVVPLEHYADDILSEATSTYETITDNIYIGSATGRSMAQESMPCQCKIESDLDNVNKACGLDDQCINRIMFMECIVDDCPSGRLCQNRRFQKHQYANVDIMLTEKKGHGLRAAEDLPMNTFIMEYIGEVIPQYEFLCRTREYDAEGYQHYYFMTLKNDEIIDATKKGCVARFMNHSCNPNCVTQKWVIGKKMRIGIFTNRYVEAGEELTFDYKFERYGAMAQPCFCGEYNCKGFIGASDEADAKPEYTLTYDYDISSSDDEYYYEETQQQSNDDEVKTHRPIENKEKVHSFVKRMLNSVGKPRAVNKLLMRLKATNPNNSKGRDILRTIIRLHGLKMLKFWLGEWKHNEVIVQKALQVLEMLPLANRNGLDDCKMCEIVHRFVGHDNDQISVLSEKLLENWSHLKNVYRIPKRAHQGDTTHRHPPPLSPLSTCSNDEQVIDQKLQPEQHESTDPPASSIQISTPVSIAPSPLPSPSTSSSSSSSYASSNGRKRRYESTREFFDPDSDYFEYISMQTPTQSELERVMEYPPQPFIPTAPRAMLDHYPKDSLHYTQKYHQNKYLKNDSTQVEPVYCDYSYYYSLPPNWGATTTLDGSLYYYNVETGSTQWEQPCDDTSDASSYEFKSMMPTPVTSTNSSVDEDACLSDIDLKMEVGKVVTKYLSTVKSLNDKVAFKQLARKLTHYIVNKNIELGRKLKCIDLAEKARIELFINQSIHGTKD